MGKEPEKAAPTRSPGRTPASTSNWTVRAAMSELAVVRLASRAPLVVVMGV